MSKEHHDLARIYDAAELIYSAYKRCRCGAGLAYPKSNKDPYHFWACSDIMTTELKFRPVNQPLGPFDPGIIEDEHSVKHDCAFSFVFHEIARETEEVTTRPRKEVEYVNVKRRKKNGT